MTIKLEWTLIVLLLTSTLELVTLSFFTILKVFTIEYNVKTVLNKIILAQIK